MKTTLKIKQTAYPDGTTVKYLYGMAQPEVKNLGHLMKEAVYNYIIHYTIYSI
ncbi:MAG: hypothetical protein K0S09_2604 [Sphingobacteriaceae bacterium]|nr:hypothetical protein [Sphingobacteriaceae bacterium]